MDKRKLKKSEPCVVELLDKDTWERICYPGIKVGSKEMALVEDGKDPIPASSYQEALDIATAKVSEMKDRLNAE